MLLREYKEIDQTATCSIYFARVSACFQAWGPRESLEKKKHCSLAVELCSDHGCSGLPCIVSAARILLRSQDLPARTTGLQDTCLLRFLTVSDSPAASISGLTQLLTSLTVCHSNFTCGGFYLTNSSLYSTCFYVLFHCSWNSFSSLPCSISLRGVWSLQNWNLFLTKQAYFEIKLFHKYWSSIPLLAEGLHTVYPSLCSAASMQPFLHLSLQGTGST